MTNQDEALRADVRRLGDLLGQTLVRQEGQELLDLVESVRKAVREGSGAEVLKDLSVEDSIQLVRAFSTYFPPGKCCRTSKPCTYSCGITRSGKFLDFARCR
jgi:phosphoenolpyruvate carboxylase